MDVAFAILRNIVVGNAVEDDASAFRVGAGKGKVDDGAGLPLLMTASLFWMFSMALMRENLVNANSWPGSARI